MRLDVIFTANEITEDKIKGKNIVAIDVLRATSVMITALSNNINKINVFETSDEVRTFSKKDKDAILCGERKGIKIHDFDYGNSPLEYKNNENIIGKKMYMTTSNGTKTLVRSNSGNKIFIGGFLNLDAVVDTILKGNLDTVLICSGTDGEYSLDDCLCASMMINSLLEKNPDLSLSDSAIATKFIYNKNQTIHEILKNSKHYSYLESLNLYEDLDFCLSTNTYNFVPICKGNIVSL